MHQNCIRVTSLVPSSMTTDCHNCSKMSCTGLTLQRECSTSSQSRWYNICRIKHQNTWSTAAFRCPTSPLVNIYSPPVDITWLPCYPDEAWFGPSLLGADNLGHTARRSSQPVEQCRWLPANVKDSVVHQILVFSAIETLHEIVLYKFTIDIDIRPMCLVPFSVTWLLFCSYMVLDLLAIQSCLLNLIDITMQLLFVTSWCVVGCAR